MDNLMLSICHPERKHCARGLCERCYYQQYRKKNPATASARRNWHSANPNKQRVYKLKHRYGAAAAEAFAQRVICDACKEPVVGRNKHVDHSHRKGLTKEQAFRGILCGDCNNALGRLGDNTTKILALAEYNKRYESRESL